MAWDEAIAASHLWQHVLEEKGYQVELQEFSFPYWEDLGRPA